MTERVVVDEKSVREMADEYGDRWAHLWSYLGEGDMTAGYQDWMEETSAAATVARAAQLVAWRHGIVTCACESSECGHHEDALDCRVKEDPAWTTELGWVCGRCRLNYAAAGYPLHGPDAVIEEAEEDAWDEVTAVTFMEYLCEDSGMAGGVVADIRPAKDDGWLVEDGVALVETGDGRRFIVRVQEVNR